MCHNAKRIRVRIENPLPGCQDSTSLERARRYERQKRAVFVSALVIRFVAHQRNTAAAAHSERGYARYTDGLAPIEASKHLPLAGDAVRLYIGKRLTSEAREDRVVEISSRRMVYGVDASGKLQHVEAVAV